MERKDATLWLRQEMDMRGLTDWSIRLNQNADSGFLGMCLYRDKTIVMSAHHIDIHPEADIKNTGRHEIAHALVGAGHAHDEVWEAKAWEVGCDNTQPCSNLSLSPDVIDAIRSGATVEISFTEQVIRTPKYTITRIQDKCEVCGKVAVEKSSNTIISPGDDVPDIKFITLECGHMIFKKIPKGTPFHRFQAFGDVNCTHEWDKNSCILCNRKRPYPFQLEGMKVGEKGLAVQKGFAFFDEMGLGKTIQAGGLVYFHPELWPVLWVVKSGLKYQTASFIINWMDGHVPQIINTSKDWLIPGLKHYIVGYDMLVPKVKKLKSGKTSVSGFDIEQFDRVGIKCVVLDECQQIKNVDSTRTQMVRKVCKTRKVIGLSGTPWNNKGSELYPILNMMDPIKFSTEAGFKRTWVGTYFSGKYEKEGGIRTSAYVGGSRVTFKEHTKDLCIRRERKEVMSELPTINRTKLNVTFTPTDEKIYDEAVEEFVQWYEAQMGDISGMSIIGALAKMRYLVAMAKIETTKEYVDEFIEDTDRKLVIFAHHQDAQQILYEDIRLAYDMPNGQRKKIDGVEVERIKILQYTAEMNSLQRNECQDTFNATPRVILVASQGAAGEGLNLQTCSDCIMHERQWNPGREEQCEGRFIRIGSTATQVNAIYTELVGLTTTDPVLDGIVSRKRGQFHNWTGTDAEKWNEESIMRELADTIVKAHRGKKAA